MRSLTDDAIEQLIRPVTAKSLWRVFPIKYTSTPLGMGYGAGRFSAPQREFKMLYAAVSFETALREGLIRDRFDARRYRRMAAHILRGQASAFIKTTRPLELVDLTDGKASDVGLPSRIRHSKHYDAARRFSLQVHHDHARVDGILYRSRLDDQLCVAIFDRAVASKLQAIKTMRLDRNPLLRPALEKMRIKTYTLKKIPS